jgi:hypothetical protein
MAGDGTIVLALEGQLRLDDQPALHQALELALRTPGGRLLVLASRPEGQRLRGPHQRRAGFLVEHPAENGMRLGIKTNRQHQGHTQNGHGNVVAFHDLRS